MGCLKFCAGGTGFVVLCLGGGLGVRIWNTTNYYSSWPDVLGQVGFMVVLVFAGLGLMSFASGIEYTPPTTPEYQEQPQPQEVEHSIMRRPPSKPAHYVSKEWDANGHHFFAAINQANGNVDVAVDGRLAVERGTPEEAQRGIDRLAGVAGNIDNMMRQHALPPADGEDDGGFWRLVR